MLSCFSNTFDIVNADAGNIWASNNYYFLVDEYIDKPTLPPPLIVISYIFRFILYIIQEICFFKCVSQKVVDEGNHEISFCL
jgi:hypothetical protein